MEDSQVQQQPISTPAHQIQPQPVPVVDDVSPQRNTRKKPFLLILVIMLMIILLVSISIVLVKQRHATKQNTAPLSSQQPLKKSAQPGQKIYSTKSNQFSFPYPTSYQVKETTVGMGVSTVDVRSTDNQNTAQTDIQMLTIPKLIAKTIGQDFDEYYAMPDNSSKTISLQNQSTTITKVSNRSVNNLRAFNFKSTVSNNTEGTIGVYIDLGDKILIISTSPANKDKLEAMLQDFRYQQ